MTGLWQIAGRSALDFDDLVRLDFYYLEHWSIWLDISILAQDDPRRPRAPRRLLAPPRSPSPTARGPALLRMLDSLEGQDGLGSRSWSTTAEAAPRSKRPSARGCAVVDAGENLGFAAGSNLGAREAAGSVLVFLNPDTVVAPGAIAQLARTLEDPSIAIAMARLRLLDEPEKLNASGVDVHVTGIGWAADYGEPADSVREVGDVPAASGTAMAIRAETFRDLGGFADELFMYLEDLELGWRARLAGYRVVVDPGADVFHEYEYGRNPRKSYFLERNRLIFLSLGVLGAPAAVARRRSAGHRARDGRPWPRSAGFGTRWPAGGGWSGTQARSPAAPARPRACGAFAIASSPST